VSFYRKEKDSFRVTLNRISTRTWKRDALLCISGLDLMGLFPSTPAESNGLYHNKKKEVLHCLSLPPLYLNIHYKSNSINQKESKTASLEKRSTTDHITAASLHSHHCSQSALPLQKADGPHSCICYLPRTRIVLPEGSLDLDRVETSLSIDDLE